MNIFNIKKRYTKEIILIISVVSLLFINFYHEIWRDEGETILISNELSFLEIFKYSPYMGFVTIHMTIIKFLSIITHNPLISAKIINVFFFYLSFYFILQKKKIPIYITLIFMLSYPIFAEYGLISRHYILMLPFIIFLTLNPPENNKINHIYFSLSWLCLNGIFGIIIASSYVIVNFNFFFKQLSNSYKIYIVGAIALLSIYTVSPIFHEDINWNELRSFDITNFFKKINIIISTQLYTVNFFEDHNLWSNNYLITNYYTKFFAYFFCLLLYLVFNIFLLVNKNFKDLFYLNLILILMGILFSVQYRGDYRHFFLFTVILFLCAIKQLYLSKINLFDKKIHNFVKFIFFILIVFSALNSIVFSIKEIKYNFSNGKILANYLKSKNINCKNVISFPAWSSHSWIPYMDKNCVTYQLEHKRYSSFNRMNMNNNKIKIEEINFDKLKKFKLIIISCDINGDHDCNDEIKIVKHLNNNLTIIKFDSPTINRYEKFILLKHNK